MRVAQVIGKLSAAGVESVVNNYYRVINYSRIQFDYFIDDDSICEPPEEMIARGARYYRIPSTRHVYSRIHSLYQLFKQNGYKIVHSHMNSLNMPVLLAARLANVPIRISHSHSTSDLTEGYRAALKHLLRPTARWWATDYMACGRWAGQWMFSYKEVQDGRVIILPNAIDVEKFRFCEETRTAVRSELGLECRFVVGHVGRFMQQKNHAFLLKAFAALHKRRPDAVLLLVGDGELRVTIEKSVEMQGLEDSVRFLGIRKDVDRLYNAMDVFVLPSVYEGLPVVGVEAQAAGLPCIFSTHVDSGAAVGGEVHFLSLESGPEAWSRTIEQCAGRTERLQMADVVRVRGYDIHLAGERLETIYETLAKREEY